jgi:D-3-phosphoglycerate dehydrogenase
MSPRTPHSSNVFVSPSGGHLQLYRSEATPIQAARVLRPLATDEFRLLLLENISQNAVESFKNQGYQVDWYPKAWSEDELVEKIGSYHAIGIRSKTKITARVLKAASKVRFLLLFFSLSSSDIRIISLQLLVIGCFCIGTNQVDLAAAGKAGIPVFNSPFSNSRSVAELVIGEIISLSRQLCERTIEMKNGTWNKVAKGCWEIRGKTLGIVGYGHIGSQLSVLAESFGMRVIFYDVLNLMPLGSAIQVERLEDLLAEADFVTLHVPELPDTIKMISTPQLAAMKRGAYLINNARGKVVDIPALINSLQQKHLAGAAIDVYPAEPGSNGNGFNDSLNSWATALRAIPNLILTPHIGGSTEEAQRMIGLEVSSALTRYLNFGTTLGAVNFPEVDLRAITPEQHNQIRLCYIHTNQPGVLKQLNEILGHYNVEKQYSDSKGDIAYLMSDIADVSPADIEALEHSVRQTKASILTRLLT